MISSFALKYFLSFSPLFIAGLLSMWPSLTSDSTPIPFRLFWWFKFQNNVLSWELRIFCLNVSCKGEKFFNKESSSLLTLHWNSHGFKPILFLDMLLVNMKWTYCTRIFRWCLCSTLSLLPQSSRTSLFSWRWFKVCWCERIWFGEYWDL